MERTETVKAAKKPKKAVKETPAEVKKESADEQPKLKKGETNALTKLSGQDGRQAAEK